MLFNSSVYLFFFLPLVLTLYLPLRDRVSARNAFLLAASLLFYFQGEKQYTLILVAMIAVNYLLGLMIDRAGAHKKKALVVAVIVNLLPLVYIKYSGFLIENVNVIAGLFGSAGFAIGERHLPIGISYFTFMTLSYVIDVSRGRGPVLKNPVDLGLYVSFFPKLTMGPLASYASMSGELFTRRMNLDDFAWGVRRFIIGFGKKAIIANALSPQVNKLFSANPAEFTWVVAWMAPIFYILQLYFDFSGYSDMAIGVARMFGFRLPENFNYPYAARSVKVFWQRWHITLLSWMRDYVYIPLGGSRVSKARSYFNLVFVFLLTGLWHGANWTFVLWGLWNGIILIIERLLPKDFFERLWRPIGNAYTMICFFMSAALFRPDTISQSFILIKAMFGFSNPTGRYPVSFFFNNEVIVAFILACVGSYPIVPFLKGIIEQRIGAMSGRTASAAAWCYGFATITVLAGITVLSLMSIASDTFTPFVYNRF